MGGCLVIGTQMAQTNSVKTKRSAHVAMESFGQRLEAEKWNNISSTKQDTEKSIIAINE
jgi:hypothetical protein